MPVSKRLLTVLSVLLICIGFDQVAKTVAEHYLQANYVSLFADTLHLQVVHNGGAFLGLGASAPEAWRLAAFQSGVAVVLICLLCYTLFAKFESSTTVAWSALVIAGGAGNLLDRIMTRGYVVDFINLGLGPLRTGVFNFADVAISAGVLLLFLQSWRRQQSLTKTSSLSR
jgi:signal peptidase II